MPESHLQANGRKLRIGFVHRLDARRILSWSGTLFFMAKALNDHVGEVVYLGPDNSFVTSLSVDLLTRLNMFWKRRTGRCILTEHLHPLSRHAGRFFERRIAEQPCDILFAPAASVQIAHIQTDLPIVYTSDANWADLIAYVPEVRPAFEFGRRQGDYIELAAITRADAVVYPSKWPIATARNYYGAPQEKLYHFPLGANLEDVPSRESALQRRFTGRVNLLMMGVDWARKGGAIAYECMASLVARGMDAHLTVCGCVPPAGFEHPNLRVIPFLNKNVPEERAQVTRLFQEAHFLILATRAEAFGVVICEASAHGLPSLVSDTGGTSGALHDGRNGYLMPYEASGADYADRVMRVIADPEQYSALVVSSRNEYEKSLNWDAWGRSMRRVMEDVLARRDETIAVGSNRG